MKRNTIIKVMSASILAASLAVVDFPTNLQKTKYIHAVGTQEVSVDVAAHLLNANNSGQRSMGDAALEKVSIKKVGNQYQYTIIWKDLNFNGQSDGISKFWVEGKEVQLSPTTYPNVSKPKQAVFTLPELKSTLNVEVFVQIMEDIMPGAGRKSAILQLDTNGVSKKLETSTTDKSAQADNNPKQAETDNSAKEDASQNSAAKAAKEKAEAERLAKEKAEKEKAEKEKAEKEKAEKVKTEKEEPKKSPPPPKKETPVPSTPKGGKLEDVIFFREVEVSLLMASNPGQLSMGHKALGGITVFRDSRNTYHYIVKFHKINLGKFSDGISKFWVKGTPYPVTYTREGNQEVHFTSSEKLQKVPVSVFVKTMEEIMPGAGKKDAILSLDWSHSREEPGKFYVTGGDPGENPDEGPSGGKQAKGDKANGNSTDNSSEDNDGRVDNSEEFSNTGSNSKTGLNNKTNFKNKTNLKSPYVIIPSAISLLGAILVFIKRRLF
ncbi:hypothetical protein [Gemella sanguinis]|jgi:hypothetical protein|uniref:hypothetical protein n=1 Tax=Gemella sanguinis TaxID=84135 RepID=UPI00080765C0|nr:hypothetical protein [Gemella sanguinis]